MPPGRVVSREPAAKVARHEHIHLEKRDADYAPERSRSGIARVLIKNTSCKVDVSSQFITMHLLSRESGVVTIPRFVISFS